MRDLDPDWLIPAWDAPGVGALMTTRAGGVSAAPFDSLNLRDGLGDDPAAVRRNLERVVEAIGMPPIYLEQVHGTRVVRLSTAEASAPPPRADASLTTEPGVACAVQVADCLPVLFAVDGARAVAAAHAGWRGLAGGVLEATLGALCEAAACEPREVQAWLGACIGPRAFEVGADVLKACGVTPRAPGPYFVAQRSGKWLADLAGLARARLGAAGVERVSGGDACTVEQRSRFFSYRRDGVTGRMAALIWIDARRI